MVPSDSDSPQRKRRTRGHVIEDLSENYLERKVLSKGHLLRRPERDYGVDVTMFHFAADGSLENGEVRFQLKATDHLKANEQRKWISIPIATGDLDYWAKETYPFILIVYDARRDRAFWLDIQEFVGRHPEVIARGKEKIQVRIPLANKLTVKSVDEFRRKSLEVVAELRARARSADVKKIPR